MNVGYYYVSASSTICPQIYSLNPKNKPITKSDRVQCFGENKCLLKPVEYSALTWWLLLFGLPTSLAFQFFYLWITTLNT